MRLVFVISMLGIIIFSGMAFAVMEINTTLALYTYRIEGPTSKPNEVSYGTVFIMSIPDTNRPDISQIVLVTAAHVLEDISVEKANVYLRQKLANGTFKKVTHELTIRKGNKPLWTRHPVADIAVMKVSLPKFVSDQAEEIPLLSTDVLADDAMMERYEIHIGDQLLCLGYPLRAEANPAGFSILRSGRIASFPLTPAKDTKSLLFDIEIFEGNSGGPVYFVDRGRVYGGAIHLDETIQFIAGVITEEVYRVQRSTKQIEASRERDLYEVDVRRDKLNLAVVVPAHFVKETLDLLAKSP
jgi:S1-C subfamily serine protease